MRRHVRRPCPPLVEKELEGFIMRARLPLSRGGGRTTSLSDELARVRDAHAFCEWRSALRRAVGARAARGAQRDEIAE